MKSISSRLASLERAHLGGAAAQGVWLLWQQGICDSCCENPLTLDLRMALFLQWIGDTQFAAGTTFVLSWQNHGHWMSKDDPNRCAWRLQTYSLPGVSPRTRDNGQFLSLPQIEVLKERAARLNAALESDSPPVDFELGLLDPAWLGLNVEIGVFDRFGTRIQHEPAKALPGGAHE